MISAVILTHNDGQTVARTLQSLVFCDEIVVMDDESSDTTPGIAKSFGAKVVVRAVNGDFAAQRNAAFEEVTGDWVLFVDSDEIVTGELREEIQSAIKQKDIIGYYMKRHDTLFGRTLTHGETGRVRLLRIAKKGAGMWERPVHEVWKVQGKTGELSHPLLHFPHPNVAQFLTEINNYSTLNARYLYAQNKRVPGWHVLAYPMAKFFLNYVWFGGFLDGTAGAIAAIMMSFHSFLTRAKLYLLWHSRDESARHS